MKEFLCLFFFLWVGQLTMLPAQNLHWQFNNGLEVAGWESGEKTNRLDAPHPLFSCVINGRTYTSREAEALRQAQDTIFFQLGGLPVKLSRDGDAGPLCRYTLLFSNPSPGDTLVLENLVPLGISQDHAYLTGLGKHPLSRTHLFQPDRSPVNVIVPDNAWELGAAFVPTAKGQHLSALARRTSWDAERARRRRFETYLYPGGSVSYRCWFVNYRGDWREGLRRLFQEYYLFDLAPGTFNDTLYRRPDLQWIRRAYSMHLLMAWDRDFYDSESQTYRLPDFVERGRPLYGGDDVIGIWPNWPMLGLDQRNQWDMFRALPGGLAKLRELAAWCRSRGTRFFISYNPWDASTRWEDHHAGMSDMIGAIGADGVVLDTEGKSSREHQQAADHVRPGVIMYSEGMAVPKDMPGIVAGRVHNALYYPPLLNLNKFIRPDFAIFRVAELYLEPIRREYATSFFNGYGTEINQFRPGRPDWVEEDYRFWGRTLMILRESSDHFTSQEFTPLWPTLSDSIYVNAWLLGGKKLFTIFSLRPAGFSGPLFRTPIVADHHVVDLWNHELIEPDTVEDQWQIPVEVDGFSARWLGTNNEGAVGAIAVLPRLLHISRQGDELTIDAPRGDSIRIWAGRPAYDQRPVVFAAKKQTIRLHDYFASAEGKFVVQLMQDGSLLDEQVFTIPPGTPRLISKTTLTSSITKAPAGMVRIPAGRFRMKVTFGDNFIPHPNNYPTDTIALHAFFMDRFPVTNEQFREFLQESRYRPVDTTNFLRHWINGRIPAGQERFPVTYISYEDARAYAHWAGKRLPTEIEWQYAAQTPDGREWPWSKDAQVVRKREVITETLTVSRLQVDPAYCNPGNGQLYPVGSYPKGANPYGLQDLVGSVWQLTNDVYDNGASHFLILKGGSYYLPADSWWYVEGGPRELTYSQKLMRVSPGFERTGTVGFRCVQDYRD